MTRHKAKPAAELETVERPTRKMAKSLPGLVDGMLGAAWKQLVAMLDHSLKVTKNELKANQGRSDGARILEMEARKRTLEETLSRARHVGFPVKPKELKSWEPGDTAVHVLNEKFYKPWEAVAQLSYVERAELLDLVRWFLSSSRAQVEYVNSDLCWGFQERQREALFRAWYKLDKAHGDFKQTPKQQEQATKEALDAWSKEGFPMLPLPVATRNSDEEDERDGFEGGCDDELDAEEDCEEAAATEGPSA